MRYSFVIHPRMLQMVGSSAGCSADCRLLAIGTTLVALTMMRWCDLSVTKAEFGSVL